MLAELFRQASTKSFEETENIINSIIYRESSIPWDTGAHIRILNTKIASKDKIHSLLYICDRMIVLQLQEAIEYKNSSDFKKILRALHKERFIEYEAPKCILSPLGQIRAEKIFAAKR